MKCPVCSSSIEYKVGENTKDHHCYNINCPARIEAQYYPHVSVMPGWWFAEKFNLPFKHNGNWYAITGPHTEFYMRDASNLGKISEFLWPNSTEKYQPHQVCYFQELNIVGNITYTYRYSTQKTILKIPYMALPVNYEFNQEFQKLVSHKDIDRFLKTKSKNSLFLNPGAELMHFNNLSDNEKINAMKQEFTAIVKSFFEKPEVLKTYVASNKLSKEQAKNIFINLNKFNINKCICCRKFDPSLLKTPIDSEFEPLIELAQTTAKTKAY